jgi:hypothetical protein
VPTIWEEDPVYSMKEFGFGKQFFRGEGCPNRILLIALVG